MGADAIWIEAYERMTLDESHAWHRHTEREIVNILDRLSSGAIARIVDVGCGDGRHSVELAARGFDVLGLDISAHLVTRALPSGTANPRFQVADARRGVPEDGFDLALCLYDVIGSSARREDDASLVRALARSLRPGGYLAASVMNTGVTLGRLAPERRPMTNESFVAALEALPPSSTMEQSGSIFDPDHLLYFGSVYYRKEQFERGVSQLPAELVIRDRRFTRQELTDLLEGFGFEVLDVRPVQAGQWDREPPLDDDDERAKELFVLARLRS